MTKYQEFLNANEIISEDLFNEIIDSLPEVNISEISFNLYDYNSQDEIAQAIIEVILSNWNYAYSDNIDFKNKCFDLFVDSLEDLEEIKNKFSKWTISNYDEITEELEECNKIDIFNSRIDLIRSKATLSDLEKIIKDYAY